MPGLYIHIPFCRKLCYYCDFHFTVSLKNKNRVLKTIFTEIDRRSNEYPDIEFDTIYFGGGTPSILEVEEIDKYIRILTEKYKVSTKPEITLEANPDDLTKEYLRDIKFYTSINRLSIGIQSFIDKHLVMMNRRHTGTQAAECIENAKREGFENISIDLIYGLPKMTKKELESNLLLLNKFDIPHYSAYHLTIESKTVFSYYLKKGKMKAISEPNSLKQFEIVTSFAQKNGYDHYEISNYSKPGYYSKHNAGYWNRQYYVGFGPSAHSYYKQIRRWNISNNIKYCEAIENETEDYFDSEVLTKTMEINDYILTGLRTKWGIDLRFVRTNFGSNYSELLNSHCMKFLLTNKLQEDGERVFLTNQGKQIADYIISELLFIEDKKD